MLSRRTFVGHATTAAAGLAIASTAKSYAQIAGANDRVNFAVIGLNSRAYAHLSSLQANKKDARITAVCDVDSTILSKFAGATRKPWATPPAPTRTSARSSPPRTSTSSPSPRPTTGTPPWPSSACRPASTSTSKSPAPTTRRRAYGSSKRRRRPASSARWARSSAPPRTPSRSSTRSTPALVGRAYWAETWYANRRKPIGIGKAIPVPATLDWDLWQGPAPRQAYKTTSTPTTGTGSRLGHRRNPQQRHPRGRRRPLGPRRRVPHRVTAAGGRYAAKDDWQFYDTLDVSFEYPDQLITWKGDCCTGKKTYGRDRGIAVHGTEGTVIIDRAGYEVYDLKDKMTASYRVPATPPPPPPISSAPTA